ncbi:MAG: TolC family protein [Dysgonamonadaceae bacterium]|jgi:outer membrane protein TolC|nr:TolC family protein [Dysgonamonadaceae bacterium]
MSKSNIKICENLRIICVICVLNVLNVLSGNAQQVLTLEQCKAMALKNNAEMQNADLSVKIAEQQKKEAFTKYFPSISGTGMGFAANNPLISMDIDLSATLQPMMEGMTPLIVWLMQQGAPIDPAALQGLQQSLAQPQKIEMLKNGYVGGIMATQPIFVGGQIINGNRLAKAGAEVSRLQKQMSENEVLLATERYFWQIVSLKEKMKTIDNSAVMLDRILSDVKAAVDAGLTTRNDLLRVELEQNRLESGRLKAQNGLQILKMALALHIGLDNYDFDVENPNLESFENFPSLQGNVENRPEYQLLEKSVEVARLQQKMEIGKNLPTIAVGAGYNFMRFDWNKADGMKNDFGMLFATVSVPISDWWGGSHAIKRKKLEVLKAENTRREQSDLLRLQMQQVGNELNEAYRQILLAKKSIASAEENLKINRDNYNAGVTTLSDLLEAQNLLQQSRDQYTEAVSAYRVKQAEYEIMNGK